MYELKKVNKLRNKNSFSACQKLSLFCKLPDVFLFSVAENKVFYVKSFMINIMNKVKIL
jgi:hypothetical protein